jgi:hypothetical protein
MFSLVFISLFVGTLLGLHFRFFILVPALMLTWVVVISIGVASEPASGHFFFSELAFVQVVPMAAILWALTRRQPVLLSRSGSPLSSRLRRWSSRATPSGSNPPQASRNPSGVNKNRLFFVIEIPREGPVPDGS